jgi:hypothetical protein
MLATGCTDLIRGTAQPAPNLKPRPLTGQTIKQVLIDGAALSKILNQSFDANSHFKPWFGGADELQSSSGSPSRTDCLGVTTLQEQGAYRSANIKDVAGESWWHENGRHRLSA